MNIKTIKDKFELYLPMSYDRKLYVWYELHLIKLLTVVNIHYKRNPIIDRNMWNFQREFDDLIKNNIFWISL